MENSSFSKKSGSREIRLNRIISWVLSIGLVVAIGLLLVGVGLTVASPELDVANESSVTGIPAALAGLEPDGFFQAGLLVLLATPAARVAALFYGYARNRRWLFAGTCLFVMAVLVASAVVGLEVA